MCVIWEFIITHVQSTSLLHHKTKTNYPFEHSKGLRGITPCKQTSCTVCNFRIQYYPMHSKQAYYIIKLKPIILLSLAKVWGDSCPVNRPTVLCVISELIITHVQSTSLLHHKTYPSELGKGLRGIMPCKQTSCTVCHFRIHYYSCTANKSTTSQN